MVTCTAAGSRSQLRCGRGSRWPSSRTLGHTGQGPQPQRAGYTLGVQEPKCRSEVPRPSLPLVLGGNRWSLRSRSGSWAPGLGVGSAGPTLCDPRHWLSPNRARPPHPGPLLGGQGDWGCAPGHGAPTSAGPGGRYRLGCGSEESSSFRERPARAPNYCLSRPGTRAALARRSGLLGTVGHGSSGLFYLWGLPRSSPCPACRGPEKRASS